MAYSIQYSPHADRDFERLPSQVKGRVQAKIESLADNPRPHGCTKLKGAEMYRVRVGDYRIIYEVKDNILLVLVVKIGHRREVYD